MNRPFPDRSALDDVRHELADDLRRDTLVIGASAGGVAALRRLLGALPATLPAAVFVVLHQSSEVSELTEVLRAACRLPVRRIDAAQPIRPGTIHVAPPDRHMVLAHDEVRPVKGPHERHSRPAINPLFRTAAAARGARVIAVQLTGRLDDGVAGLAAVGRSGGLVLVQDPDEAAFPEMPRAALAAVPVDGTGTLDEIAARLSVLVHETVRPVAVPSDVALEARLLTDRPSIAGDEDLAGSLLVAVQALEERVDTLNRLATNGERRHPRAAAAYRERAADCAVHIDRLRRFVLDTSDADGSRTAGVPANDPANDPVPGESRRSVPAGRPT